MGLCILSYSSALLSDLHLLALVCIFVSQFYFVQLYLQNILYTKSVDSRICTSNSQIGQISSARFFLSEFPSLLIPTSSAESKLTCVYGLYMHLLLLFLFRSSHIAFSVSSLFLLYIFHKSLAFCTLASALYCRFVNHLGHERKKELLSEKATSKDA